MSITADQFDALDHLHTIDAGVRWITRDDLATTLGISGEATHLRMRRLESAGLVDIDRPKDDPLRYRVSVDGQNAYRLYVLRMDGVTGPPATDPLIDLPSLIAARIITLDTKDIAA